MKRLLVTPAVAALLALPALPAAHAAPATRYEGHCGFDTVRSKDANGALGQELNRYTGVAYAVVYASDDYGIPEPESTISITCEVYVNGVFADAVQGTPGTGVAVVAGVVSYLAEPDDIIELCDRVLLDGVESFGCSWAGDPQTPPRQVQGVLNRVVDVAEMVESVVDSVNETVVEPIVDPLVCPLLAGLAPGTPGLLDVTPEGDISVIGSVVWDCPPYGT